MRKKLIDEVSIQELQQMRADGLTNQQIADRLDVSRFTVHRYLGPQPEGLKAPYGAYTARVKDVEPVEKPVKTGREMSIQKQFSKTMYSGDDFDFIVCSTGNIEVIKRGSDEIMTLTVNNYNKLIRGLLDIVYVLREEVC